MSKNFIPPERRRLAIAVITDPLTAWSPLRTRAEASNTNSNAAYRIDAPFELRTSSVASTLVHFLAAVVIGVVFVGVIFDTSLAADIMSQPTLTTDGAKSIGANAIALAREKRAPGAAVAIVDAAGNLLYLERLDGTFAASATVSTGKARTAIYFKKPTRFFEDVVNKGRYAMLAVPEIAPFTPLMGGVPIEANGVVVGAIGVSGASSAQQDDEIATAAAEVFARAHQTASQVSYVPRAQVDAGFRSDSNLITTDT